MMIEIQMHKQNLAEKKHAIIADIFPSLEVIVTISNYRW